MSPERWRRIEELFDLAADLPPLERRAALERACTGDPALLEEIMRLLAHDDSGGARIADVLEGVSRLQTPDEPVVVGRRLGAYRVVRELGRGGMGVVYGPLGTTTSTGSGSRSRWRRGPRTPSSSSAGFVTSGRSSPGSSIRTSPVSSTAGRRRRGSRSSRWSTWRASPSTGSPASGACPSAPGSSCSCRCATPSSMPIRTWWSTAT